jgi:hypothetical protein
MRFSRSLFGWRIGMMVEKMPDVPTAGITNETVDSFFVPFMDYDGAEYSVVINDLNHLRKVFGLCTFVILCNSEEQVADQWGGEITVGNYNVVGLDKLTFWDHMHMLQHTRCDWNFKSVVRVYSRRNWVLRMDEKLDDNGSQLKAAPVVKDVLRFGKCSFEHSDAHAAFMKERFGLDFPKLKRRDGFKSIGVIEYNTRRKK